MGSETIRDLDLANPSQTWLALRQHVEAYVNARDASGTPPRLGDFLPAQPEVLRRLVLVELVKIDLDYRYNTLQQAPRLEDYIRDYPELANDELTCDLIYEEYHARRQAGLTVDPKEYYRRFPAQTSELRRLLEPDRTVASSSRPPAPVPEPLQPGQQIDDFDLLLPLGEGAFASVYLARQRSMQRLVALKVSNTRGAEPQTLAQLDHPNIVRVYDQRVLPDRHLCLLYMQYVQGGTLQAVIARVNQVEPENRTGRLLLEVVDQALEQRGETPGESSLRQRLATMSWPEVVCWVGARLAAALDHAHRQGILHRDVKPPNVLLTAEGMPRLADFNVSCSSKLEGAGPAAFFGGSLAYMSPEQLEACSPAHSRPIDSLDGRSDQFSLGVMLWELLTGHRPFLNLPVVASWAQLLQQMLSQRLIGPDFPVAPLPPRYPTALEDILGTCMQPDPNRRFASCAELAAQLELCLQPQTRDLLHPPPLGWRHWIRRHVMLCIVLTALIPNILLAAFNFAYNDQEIIGDLKGSEETFMRVQMIVNSTAFPLGIGVCVWLIWPVAQALRRLENGQQIEADRLPDLRRRCLQLGPIMAGVCLTAWLIASIAYPLSISAAWGEMGADKVLEFVASLTLCGLMAAAYPFFGVTFITVRALYPALLRPGATLKEDLKELKRLNIWISIYLVLASSVPLLALTTLAVIQKGKQFLLAILGLGGLIGFGASYGLSRLIQKDLEALAFALDPFRERQP